MLRVRRVEPATLPVRLQGPYVQVRYSTKYLKHEFVETRQPDWIDHRRFPIYSRDHLVQHEKSWKPMWRHKVHMNLWAEDTDGSTNHLFNKYWNQVEKRNALLGRPTSIDAPGSDYNYQLSATELNNDMRYWGHHRRAALNNWFEPERTRPLYHPAAAQVGARASRDAAFPKGVAASTGGVGAASKAKREASAAAAACGSKNSPLTKDLAAKGITKASQNVTTTLSGVQDFSRRDAAAWWKELATRIETHGAAVGDFAPSQSRNSQEIHRCFVDFQTAITGFQFQDRDLADLLAETRPATLDDLYATFLEMEANYINEEYCPRCSLPFATTTHCGEGVPNSPFRAWRGKPVPHKPWGKEWYDAIARRAEAVWARAVEDPLFGNSTIPSLQGTPGLATRHTQRQTEAMLAVLCKSKQRGKANAFMAAIKGSSEFRDGAIVITESMMAQYDNLLDTTPHPHMLTNASKASAGSAKYVGEGGVPAQSAAQLRVDMEVAKFRREQREEGVVRIPPAGWAIDTASVVPYEVVEGRVANWREVKTSIEKSFIATGLPQTAWTAAERREMVALEARIQGKEASRVAHEARLVVDRKRIADAKGTVFVFPDAAGPRAFNKSKAAIEAFNLPEAAHGTQYQAQRRVFLIPEAVPLPKHLIVTNGGSATDVAADSADAGSTETVVDTRDSATRLFGEAFAVGTVIEVDGDERGASSMQLTVIGVDVTGPADKHSLLASLVDDPDSVVRMGTDLREIRARYGNPKIIRRHETSPLLKMWMESGQHATGEERAGFPQMAWDQFECLTIVGVSDKVLFAQLEDGAVASPLGLEISPVFWAFTLKRNAAGGPVRAVPSEPFSWLSPFRNDWSEERLEELKRAPWNREEFAPLTVNRYTPKVKRFGYTQHTTQDDFVTKEYKDRLTARQVFADPERFQVIPDALESTVSFGPRTESERLSGTPAVDRRELDLGWAPQPEVPAAEVAAVEQALRDISGRRPGNFVKAPREAASLKLDESWWRPLQYGWQQAEEDNKFAHPSEQTSVSPAGLPFAGGLPVANKSMGIGERIREIAEDWAKGFGIGPHGAGPGHNTRHYDTLGDATRRAGAANYVHVLLRLFESRLVSDGYGGDAAAFVATHPTAKRSEPKTILAAINEFRQGRPPALALVSVLVQYLADDIAKLNARLPKGVPALNLDASGGVTNTLALSPGSTHVVDADRDRHRRQAAVMGIGVHSATGAGRSGAGSGYVLQQFLDASLAPAARAGGSSELRAELTQQQTRRFMLALTSIIGEGIDAAQSKAFVREDRKGPGAAAATMPPQLIRGSKLAALLARFGIQREELARIMRGLRTVAAGVAQQATLGDDFVVPADVVLSWTPPPPTVAAAEQTEKSAGGAKPAAAINFGLPASVANGPAAKHLQRASAIADGLVQDQLYRIRMNGQRLGLRRSLELLFPPNSDASKAHGGADGLWESYLVGDFAPRADVAVAAVVDLLRCVHVTARRGGVGSNAAEQARGKAGRALLTTSKVTAGMPRRDGPVVVPATAVDEMPFEFDNVAHEKAATAEHFRTWRIPMGPDTRRQPLLPPTTEAPRRDDGEGAAPSKPRPTDDRTRLVSGGFLGVPSDVIVTLMPGKSCGLHQMIANLKISGDLAPGLPMGRLATHEVEAVRLANAIISRCLPLLAQQRQFAADSTRMVERQERWAEKQLAGLQALHSQSADATMEKNFLRNAERYWHRVLEQADRRRQMQNDQVRSGTGPGRGPRGPKAGGTVRMHGFRAQQQAQAKAGAAPKHQTGGDKTPASQ